jgi:FkbM family methyltransferase
LAALPKYTATTTTLLGPELRLTDPATVGVQYRAIFEREEYRFDAGTDTPLILDCGANIGLATIYWKRLYPASTIIAFEADPAVFDVLSWNVARLRLTGVTLVAKAISDRDGEMSFWAEGADSGRLADVIPSQTGTLKRVPTVRLRHYLEQHIDLLKLDIEGAEVDVLLDSADRLVNVDNIIVEYHSLRGKDQRLSQLITALTSAGFRIRMWNQMPARQPFLQRPNYHGMDLQLDIVCTR